MQTETKIIIVEDHTILRAGLRSLLSARSAYKVVGEAKDGLEAIKISKTLNPDLVLIDLSMPRMNGSTAIREIKGQDEHIKALVLTVHKEEEYIREAFEAGADGYCLKEATHSELTSAIENIMSGNKYISPSISDKLLHGFLVRHDPSNTIEPSNALTSRENEVLKLIGEGNQNKTISKFLALNAKTVEKHRSKIMHKLNLHNASELTAYAVKKGLVATSRESR
jgi:DNA-binding NarL/FixJ family response regulator